MRQGGKCSSSLLRSCFSISAFRNQIFLFAFKRLFPVKLSVDLGFPAQLIPASCAVFAGAAVSQPGALQSCGEVRQPDGAHPAASAGREAPVQPGLLRDPQ